jgi:hypothetical protein
MVFMARRPSSARMYGSHIERIEAKPRVAVLRDAQGEVIPLSKRFGSSEDIREAVDAFHAAQLKRIFAGDKTLGENRDAIEQAFARHRIRATAEALEAMREALDFLEQAFGEDCGLMQVHDLITRLTAAIAKIEGEQP